MTVPRIAEPSEAERRVHQLRQQAQIPATAAPPTSARSEHDCNAHARPYVSSGALGHGWECGFCGAFLQAG